MSLLCICLKGKGAYDVFFSPILVYSVLPTSLKGGTCHYSVLLYKGMPTLNAPPLDLRV